MNAQPLFVTGNTFPVKDQLRALGCRWNADHKVWTTTDPATLEKANAVVAAGVKAEMMASRASGVYASGARGYWPSKRCRECKGPIVHAPHYRAMDGMCGYCAFDEYDG